MLPNKTEKPSGGASAGIAPGEDRRSIESAAETTHRIANNLSLLVALVQLQSSRLKREGATMSAAQAASLLEEVSARIETVARLHRLLSTKHGAPRVDLATYLRELCERAALSGAGARSVRFAPEPGCDCSVSPDESLPLALIVNEAVSNAIRHARPAGEPVAVRIGCRDMPDGTLAVEIDDDGQGLPPGLDPEAGGGLGFQAMRLLARQLEARLAFESGPAGTRCTVTLPPRPVY